MNTSPITATLSETSPRAEAWRAIYGRLDGIPLQSVVPIAVHVPVKGDTLAYLLDLERITPDERQRLIAHLAASFNYSRETVEQNLDQMGVPILVEDVIVTLLPAFSLWSALDALDEDDDDDF